MHDNQTNTADRNREELPIPLAFPLDPDNVLTRDNLIRNTTFADLHELGIAPDKMEHS